MEGRSTGECCDRAIIIVAVKKCLDRVSSEQKEILFHLFVILVLPLFIDISDVEIVLFWWDKWSLEFSIIEIFPGKIAQPRVVLDLIRAVESQSVHGLSLDHSIYKICCLNAPSSRDVASLDLNLLAKNVVPNFFPAFAKVRTSSHHALIRNNTYSKVIHTDSVVLSAHHLWSHVARGATSVLIIFRSPLSCNSKIGNSHVAILF